jgi:AAA domain
MSGSTTKKSLVPDLALAEAFWSAFAPGEPARLRFLLRGHASHEKEYPTVADAWPDVLRFQGMGYGVFYFPNRVDDGTKGFACDRDVRQIRAFWADCDDSGLPCDWEWHVDPDLIVYTSKTADGTQKGQLLWRVQAGAGGGMTADTSYGDMFKERQCRVISKYDADPAACNVARVLRLPGSLHLKDPGNPQIVTFERRYAGELRRDSAILEGLPELPPRAKPGEKQSSPVTQERLAEMLGWIDPDCDYDAWKNVVIAIRSTKLDTTIPAALAAKIGPGLVASEDERLREVAHRWSRGELDRRGKYADGPPAAYYSKEDGAPCGDVLDKLFGHVDPQRAGGAGFGTIVHAAKLGGWQPPATQPKPAGRWHNPSEYRDKPDPEFWDDDGMFPRTHSGSIGNVFAQPSAHKSNIVKWLMLEAVQTKSALVAYAAGEGGYSVGKKRLPAHARARHVDESAFDVQRGPDGQWRGFKLSEDVPLLHKPDSVNAFIKSIQKEFPRDPDFIVIDTLATATAGLDENTNAMSEVLTGNGGAGRIRTTFKACVIVISHEGKDPTKGVRGHSGLFGNVDFEIRIKYDKERGLAVMNVTKQRDGDPDVTAYWQIPRTPKGVFPVPIKLRNLDAFKAAGGGDDDEKKEESNAAKWRARVQKYIIQVREANLAEEIKQEKEKGGKLMKHQREPYLPLADFTHGKNDMDMAEALLKDSDHPMPPKTNFKAHEDWLNLRQKFYKKLRAAHRGKAAIGLGSEDNYVENGKSTQEWRWHDAAQHPTSIPAAIHEVESDPFEVIERKLLG